MMKRESLFVLLTRCREKGMSILKRPECFVESEKHHREEAAVEIRAVV
jgi:hypothetical protein